MDRLSQLTLAEGGWIYWPGPVFPTFSLPREKRLDLTRRRLGSMNRSGSDLWVENSSASLSRALITFSQRREGITIASVCFLFVSSVGSAVF